MQNNSTVQDEIRSPLSIAGNFQLSVRGATSESGRAMWVGSQKKQERKNKEQNPSRLETHRRDGCGRKRRFLLRVRHERTLAGHHG